MNNTKGGFVYILTNPTKRVLYVGVTSDLKGRIWEHRTKHYPKSYTAKYNCTLLVYYDEFSNITDAIAEEKRIKATNRLKKEQMITRMNSDWDDLWVIVKDW